MTLFMARGLGETKWQAHLVAVLQRRPVPAGVGDPETVHDHLRTRMARDAQRTRHIQRLQEPPVRKATTTLAEPIRTAGIADGSGLLCRRAWQQFVRCDPQHQHKLILLHHHRVGGKH